MSNTLVLPGPFEISINHRETHPLADDRLYWMIQRNGMDSRDIIGCLTTDCLINCFIDNVFNPGGLEVSGSSLWRTDEKLYLERESQYALKWDGVTLTVNPSLIPKTRLHEFEEIVYWEGWDWEVTARPVVDPKLTRLLDSFDYWWSSPPMLSTYEKLPVEVVALVELDNRQRFKDGFNWSKDWAVNPEYAAQVTGMTDTQKEILLGLIGEWHQSVNDLLETVKKI